MTKADQMERAIDQVIDSGEFPQWNTRSAAPVILNRESLSKFVGAVLGAMDQNKPGMKSTIDRAIEAVEKLLIQNSKAQDEYEASPVITSPSIGLRVAEGHLLTVLRQLQREKSQQKTRSVMLESLRKNDRGPLWPNR